MIVGEIQMQQLQQGRKPVHSDNVVAAKVEVCEIVKRVQVLNLDQFAISTGALNVQMCDGLNVVLLRQLPY